MVGQRALRHKQRTVAARVLVQHHPLLAPGVAAPERVLEAVRQHTVNGVLFQLLAVVGRKVAHALRFASGLPVRMRSSERKSFRSKRSEKCWLWNSGLERDIVLLNDFCWLSKGRRPRLLLFLGQFFFRYKII